MNAENPHPVAVQSWMIRQRMKRTDYLCFKLKKGDSTWNPSGKRFVGPCTVAYTRHAMGSIQAVKVN